MSFCYQQQLVLGFPEQDDRNFATFYGGPNQSLVAHLENFWSDEYPQDNLYIWGHTGSGRTHLLHALTNLTIDTNRSGYYLAADELPTSDASWGEAQAIEKVDGLEGMDLICIDNINVIAGDPRWEEALFHLYNRMLTNGGRLVFSGPCAPRLLDIQLQDLKSRLCHSVVYQVDKLTDAEKCKAFQQHALQRGIRLSDEVANYIMSRSQRQFSNLMSLLDELDKRSLVEKRRMTIPFVKEVMNW